MNESLPPPPESISGITTAWREREHYNTAPAWCLLPFYHPLPLISRWMPSLLTLQIHIKLCFQLRLLGHRKPDNWWIHRIKCWNKFCFWPSNKMLSSGQKGGKWVSSFCTKYTAWLYYYGILDEKSNFVRLTRDSRHLCCLDRGSNVTNVAHGQLEDMYLYFIQIRYPIWIFLVLVRQFKRVNQFCFWQW